MRHLELSDGCDILLVHRASFFEKTTVEALHGTPSLTAPQDLSSYRKVFVHFLSPTVCGWIAKHPGLRFYWILYGSDVYRNPLVKTQFLLPGSHSYVQGNITDRLRWLAYRLLKARDWKQALKQVHTVLTSTPSEFDEIRRLIPIQQAETSRFFYGKSLLDAEDTKPPLELRNRLPLQMMLGHCAYPSLNHADFLLAQPERPDLVHWHLPLTYGDAKYRAWLTEKFKDRTDVTMYTKHWPIDEYHEWIAQLHGAVFHNIRPQGLANFHALISLGKPVFLNENNVVRPYYEESGLFLPGSHQFHDLHTEVLSAEKWKGNKAALQSIWNMKICRELYRSNFS